MKYTSAQVNAAFNAAAMVAAGPPYSGNLLAITADGNEFPPEWGQLYARLASVATQSKRPLTYHEILEATAAPDDSKDLARVQAIARRAKDIIEAQDIDELEPVTRAVRDIVRRHRVSTVYTKAAHDIGAGADVDTVNHRVVSKITRLTVQIADEPSFYADDFVTHEMDTPDEETGEVVMDMPVLKDLFGGVEDMIVGIRAPEKSRKSTIALIWMLSLAVQGRPSAVALLESNRRRWTYSLWAMVTNNLLYRRKQTGTLRMPDGTQVDRPLFVEARGLTKQKYKGIPAIQTAKEDARTVLQHLSKHWIVWERQFGYRRPAKVNGALGQARYDDRAPVAVFFDNADHVQPDLGKQDNTIYNRTQAAFGWFMDLRAEGHTVFALLQEKDDGRTKGGMTAADDVDMMTTQTYHQGPYPDIVSGWHETGAIDIHIELGRNSAAGSSTSTVLYVDRRSGNPLAAAPGTHKKNAGVLTPVQIIPDSLLNALGIDVTYTQEEMI